MLEEQIAKIINQLKDHEKRLQIIERSLPSPQEITEPVATSKQTTLREIVKGRKFKNGQEQIAIIVGYHERALHVLVEKNKIPTEWFNAKMPNKYNPNYLRRVKDDLIRINTDGRCDLTQSGEKFFENFLKNEPNKPTSP